MLLDLRISGLDCLREHESPSIACSLFPLCGHALTLTICVLSPYLSISVILYSKYLCHPGCSSLCFCCGNCALRWHTRTQYSRQPGWQAGRVQAEYSTRSPPGRWVLIAWMAVQFTINAWLICLMNYSNCFSRVSPLGTTRVERHSGRRQQHGVFHHLLSAPVTWLS